MRFWDAKFLGHTTSKDIYDNFIEATKKLDPSKLLSVSIDCPNVNLKFIELMQSNRDENELPALIDIGSCSLHVVHGGFKCGAEKSGWGINKILRSSYQIFH